jgi:hypothetical protein
MQVITRQGIQVASLQDTKEGLTKGVYTEKLFWINFLFKSTFI